MGSCITSAKHESLGSARAAVAERSVPSTRGADPIAQTCRQIKYPYEYHTFSAHIINRWCVPRYARVAGRDSIMETRDKPLGKGIDPRDRTELDKKLSILKSDEELSVLEAIDTAQDHLKVEEMLNTLQREMEEESRLYLRKRDCWKMCAYIFHDGTDDHNIRNIYAWIRNVDGDGRSTWTDTRQPLKTKSTKHLLKHLRRIGSSNTSTMIYQVEFHKKYGNYGKDGLRNRFRYCSPKKLPSLWKEAFCQQNMRYYWNTKTRKRSWLRPHMEGNKI